LLYNPICIYHGNCPDGFGSAWSIWKKHGYEFEYYAATHGSEPPDIRSKDVFLVDFSYKKEVVEKMMKNANSITLIDHHINAIEGLKDLKIKKFTDLEQSGCVLTWRYFNSDKHIPAFLKYIQDRDLWKFNLPNSKSVTTAILSYEYDFQVWNKLSEIPIEKLVSDGEVLYRKHIKDIKELIKTTVRRVFIAGYDVPIVNMSYFQASDACDILCENEAFACAYYFKNNNSAYFSIRSNPEYGIDVNEIAKKFGGGGHKHAAGFELKLNGDLLQSIICSTNFEK
jgi:oligoribonuclease NrnB/cAMP/cGMP phosphodiesterase (DHH superfamily)